MIEALMAFKGLTSSQWSTIGRLPCRHSTHGGVGAGRRTWIAIVVPFPTERDFRRNVGIDVSQGASGGRFAYCDSARRLMRLTIARMIAAPAAATNSIAIGGYSSTRNKAANGAPRRARMIRNAAMARKAVAN